MLHELRKAQLVHIGASLYGINLNVASRLDALAEAVAEQMRLVNPCDNAACNGGQCNPGVHAFLPTEYLANAVNDIELLLNATNNDIPTITPTSSPQHEVLPVADGAASRRQLAEAALAQAGLSADDLLVQDAPGATGIVGDPPPHNVGEFAMPSRVSGTVNKGLGGGFRSLFNRVTTPKAASPRLSTPLGRPGVVGTRSVPPPTAGNPRLPVHRPVFPPAAQAAAPPPAPATGAAADDLTTAMAKMMELLQAQQTHIAAGNKEREEERILRDQQLQNQTALTQLLQRQLAADTSSSEAPVSSTKGKVSLVPPRNPEALSLTGCALPPQYALQGDTSSLDLSSTRHKIKSGRNAGIQQDARVAETWPNQYLCPVMSDNAAGISHDKLTLVQWAGGFVAKIFAEIDASRNGAREHNQLFILMKLLRLAEMYPWNEILKMNEALFSAIERGSLTWDSRDLLEGWWSRAIEALRVRSSRPAVATKRPATTTLPASAPPAKKDRSKDIAGVSGDFLKSQNICIKWNVQTCSSTTSPHDCPDRSVTTQVKHVCGGCAFLGKPEDSSHPMKTCKYKNKEGLFR